MASKIIKDLKYTREHEWVKIDGDVAIVGITDFAQDQLEDIVYLELPEAGTSAESGEPFGSIEAVKAVEDLYAPVSGEIIEVNEALNDKPELCNQDPYGDGWLVKIRCSDTGELDALLSADDYTALTEE